MSGTAPPNPRAGRWDRRLLIRGAAALVVAGLVVGGTVLALGRDDTSTAGAVQVAGDACVEGWDGTEAGTRDLAVTNETDETTEVVLMGADRVVTYGRIEGLGPGTTRSLEVRIGPGSYIWMCHTPDGTQTPSAAWTVTEVEGDPTQYMPVTQDDLDADVSSYRTVVAGQLDGLAADVGALVSATGATDRAAAQAAWLTAHLDYERMGAAYGTFGELDGRINGRPASGDGGGDDPALTGFRELERQLWTVGVVPWADVQGTAAQLEVDLRELVADFPSQFTDPADLPLRAHEILESSLQFELNGTADQGSHTELATVRANVDGTRTVVEAITPSLGPRDPQGLAAVTRGMDDLAARLDGYRHDDGTWMALEQLSPSQRRELNGMVSQLLEDLAPIPGLLSLPTAAS